jgi:putative Ca2+/H+ antiporter (TMEM165/GDT1 family)
MDWKIAAATFTLMFLAELGDKTQLLGVARTAETGAPVSVFVGATLALALSTALGVLLGGTVSRLPDWVVRLAAGLVFTGFGMWTLWGLRRCS